MVSESGNAAALYGVSHWYGYEPHGLASKRVRRIRSRLRQRLAKVNPPRVQTLYEIALAMAITWKLRWLGKIEGELEFLLLSAGYGMSPDSGERGGPGQKEEPAESVVPADKIDELLDGFAECSVKPLELLRELDKLFMRHVTVPSTASDHDAEDTPASPSASAQIEWFEAMMSKLYSAAAALGPYISPW